MARTAARRGPGLADKDAASIVQLLRKQSPEASVAVKLVMAGEDSLLKQRLLGQLAFEPVASVPDELLVGLSDSSRWVRLATLVVLRRSSSPSAQVALARMARTDPLEHLRAEAASVLQSLPHPDK